VRLILDRALKGNASRMMALVCAGAINWTGIGSVVFALAEKSLLRYTGSSAS
jgi:hypothetical protein